VRTAEGCAGDREYIDALWTEYEPLADKHFVGEFQRDFHSRLWEMELAGMLQDLGLEPKSAGKGPDLQIKLNGVKVWFEAVAPTRGERPDAVVDYDEGAFPDRAIELRYASAAQQKFDKWKSYLEDGIVNADEAFVIAISAAKLTPAHIEEPDRLRIANILFALGETIYSVPVSGDEPSEVTMQPRPYLRKHSGAPVESAFFLKPDYDAISAVLFSPNHLKNLPQSQGRPRGDDAFLLHNPNAQVPLAIGSIRVGRETWAEGNEFRCKDWRRPRPPSPRWSPGHAFQLKRDTKLRRSRRFRNVAIPLAPGQQVFCSRRRGKWVLVSVPPADGNAWIDGWVHKKYLERVGSDD